MDIVNPSLSKVIDIINKGKSKKQFKRFQSWRVKRVSESWRKPRGIDNRMRRKFGGAPDMPGIGYKKPNAIRFLLPNGYRKIMVACVKDLEALISLNSFYCAEIRHAVGSKKRIEILERAEELGILVINKEGKLVKEEEE
ncbi:60S ribosomal protein L32 [Spraguea lophii 42_110]|uniref:Large ribosomal subunit protein eL32 n=1 Tax=Spraguea lophii (strain 42_110) TaxID=1358809 RepID=S7XKE0_SPRLO|nr:Chain LEE, 60S ribosomal protein L32 [Spraguea lophii 42_110]7QJH_KEE Chain KEE, 60S ribosomal protein L32 [Spraguea lophii 42_110]7QJH_LEE Chain LEE, 60S ribosomal protein L32 [Spraguea lophii 42_110]8BR3_LEE Chain LEE, 60S ribosomal protein L32 [Spraguea lophii 42_110]8P5D_LEE Chain LEE, 60S ribosomal protein L32 [Spraguea lophii 42_110]8P60_KEE Chain KEE, 60S ribosomal protein L32 [Spraguea lophii 42_110]8P60_LEE Chain LEE, 60S ribosomal protein L32 [Spraguea lophii 42_110]EPR79529.1 6